MAQGTITVTNGSVDVAGAGTAFSKMKPGSFLTFVLTGVAYTVAIDSVQSDTALKLAVKFDGPTTSGVAFDESPVGSMALATMGVTVQAQKALRMMIADATNWREVFSDKQTITVTLPDGTQYSGYSWGYISQLLKEINVPNLEAIRDQAVAAANSAHQSETNSYTHSQNSLQYAQQSGGSAAAALQSEQNAAVHSGNAATSATNAHNSEVASANSAASSAQSAANAQQWASAVNPDNLLTKAGNLSGLADLATARSNFQVDRLIQGANSTTLGKLNGVRLYLNDAGNAWSVVDSSFNPLALPVEGGGTGSKTASGARTNLGLKSAAIRDVGLESGNVLETGAFGLGSRNLAGVSDLWDRTLGTRMLNMTPSTSGAPPGGYSVGLRLSDRNIGSGSQPFQQQSFSTIAVSNGVIYVMSMADGNVWGWNTVYTTGNTTRAADGTLKGASPIVKIFSDGRCELNDESEGCEVSRLGVGEYLVTGCLGLNSDASWGGIYGGFDVPTDLNKQPLVWLDYEVNPDGSILVKTYHREHLDSPAFAQNKIEGFSNGDPIDVPVSQFISVRVEMP